MIASCLPAIALAQTPANDRDPAAVARGARASIVTLVLRDSSGGTVTLGSGFFTVSRGFIATSYGAIKDVKVSDIQVKVFGYNQTYRIRAIWAFSQDLDIALLQVSETIGTQMPLGSANPVVAGETVYVAADPATDANQLREAKFTDVKRIKGKCYAQIAPRVESAIGSPVVNERGQAIGILVSAPEPDQQHSFAAPVSQIIWLMSSGFASRVSGGVPENARDEECIKAFSSPRPPIVFGVPGGVAGGVSGGVPGGVPGPPPPAGEKLEPPKIIRKSGGVLQESAIKRVSPEYPFEAKAAGVGGSVVVEITVDEAGNVISARALSGHELLTGAAVGAARQWKFRGTTLSGVPVKVIGTITFNFNL